MKSEALIQKAMPKRHRFQKSAK